MSVFIYVETCYRVEAGVPEDVVADGCLGDFVAVVVEDFDFSKG